MSLLIKNQQLGPPPQIESGNHSSRFWCTQCQQYGHTRQFCRNGLNRDQRMNANGPQQNQRGQNQNQNQGNNRGPPPRGQANQNAEKKEFHHFCGRYYVVGQCWSENQGQGCSNCGGPHPSNQCRHPNKINAMPTNTQQPAQDGMKGSRPQNEGTNELKPSNFYYNGNANLPVQGGQVAQPPRQMDPSTSQDVRFMDVSTIPVALEVSPTQVNFTDGQGQCPPHANSISYELRSLEGEVVHEAPALAVTTRAMRGNVPIEVEEEEDEENPLGEVPYFSDLENVAREARKTTKVLERKNEIVHNRERSNVVHDLDGSDVGDWEGPDIPVDEFDSVRRPKANKVDGYDLWDDLSSLKADITFGQLLEISPVARKTLKGGMPVNRRARKPKTRVSARVQMQGRTREVKAVEIEVTVVDKVVPNVLVDGGSSLNILPEHTMKKLGLSLTGPSPFLINMANQSPVVPVGIIKDCRLSTGGEEYIVTFQVIKMHDNKDAFPILLGRPWLRMANAVVDWGG